MLGHTVHLKCGGGAQQRSRRWWKVRTHATGNVAQSRNVNTNKQPNSEHHNSSNVREAEQSAAGSRALASKFWVRANLSLTVLDCGSMPSSPEARRSSTRPVGVSAASPGPAPGGGKYTRNRKWPRVSALNLRKCNYCCESTFAPRLALKLRKHPFSRAALKLRKLRESHRSSARPKAAKVTHMQKALQSRESLSKRWLCILQPLLHRTRDILGHALRLR